ncbi:LuxR C-terminal-related transcriptional regulator [Streptomyces sp. NPDC093595]|uniref:LuxR C-terminal-related transcriptional regulator n=1 Tax=Streptomyces sp. NPDC093595 TaxID=3366045 RepID=UPI0038134C49
MKEDTESGPAVPGNRGDELLEPRGRLRRQEVEVEGFFLRRRWPIAERDRELRAFREVVRESRQNAFVIYGTAGVGKSRFAEECLEIASRAGRPTARAVVTTSTASLPLGAIAHLLPPQMGLSNPQESFPKIVQLILGRNSVQPVWFIDDAHLLDASSIILLSRLLDARAIFLIATVRSSEPVMEEFETLEQPDRTVKIELSEFTAEQVKSLLFQALDGPIETSAAYELNNLSKGNALFLRELVDGALRSGALTRRGKIWELVPGKSVGATHLIDRIKMRLDAAGPEATPVLELLSLCEPLAWADAIEEASESQLLALESQGLVRFHSERRRRLVTFFHPLYAEAVRSTLPALRRRSALLRQVRRVEQRGLRRRQDALNLASWQLAATGTADPNLLLKAATIAQYAQDYTRACALLRAIPPDVRSIESQCLLGEALFENCQNDEAEAVFAEAYKSANTPEEKLQVVVPYTQNLHWSRDANEKALALCDDTRKELAGRPELLRILDVHDGTLRASMGHIREGLYYIRRGGDLREIPEGRVRYSAKIFESAAVKATGRITEAIEIAERAYREDEATQTFPAVQLASLSLALNDFGDFRRAEEVANKGLQDSIAARARIPQVVLSICLGLSNWLAGKPATARHWYDEATALALKYRPPLARVASSGSAACSAVLGDLGSAQQSVSSLRSYKHMGTLASEEVLGEAWAFAAQGRSREARKILSRAAADARRRGAVTGEALLLTDIARLGGAQVAAPRLTELAKQCEGPLTQARSHFATALMLKDPESLFAAGEELLSIGSYLVAAEALAAAAAAYHKAGAARMAAAARSLSLKAEESCEGALTPLLVRRNETTAALTEREREIAWLAAWGISSAAIAQQLGVSTRTVENHLQRIYDKLSVSSRAELAEALRVPLG